VWTEYADENGHPYYVHSATGESKWEPPEWVEETDAASGAKYVFCYTQFSLFSCLWLSHRSITTCLPACLPACIL
jgi:hypothetical protein